MAKPSRSLFVALFVCCRRPYFWIFAAYLASRFFNRSGAFGSPASNVQDAAAIFLSVANVYFSACAAGAITGCGPNGIYWTVSLNSSSTRLFPVLILLRNRMIVIICLLVFLFFAVVQRDIWIWFNRADTIAVGVMIGLLSKTTSYAPIGRFVIFLKYGALRAISTATLLGFLLLGPPDCFQQWLSPVHSGAGNNYVRPDCAASVI